MRIPYANLQVTTASVAPTAQSGGPLEVSWRIDNVGIGRTSTSAWTDTVQLATNPDGTGVVLTRTFDHLGILAAGTGYDRTVQLQLPNGFTGTYYVFVSTGGPFEFIYTDDNRALAGQTEVTLAPSPDLVVTDIRAPLEGLEGQPIEIGWTVLNQGDAPAGGTWTDTVLLRKLGDPDTPPFTLGTFTYAAGLGPGLSYSRTERFNVPMLVGSWQVEVVTNSGRTLYEHGDAANNNRLADDQAVTLSARPRPDLQIESITAPPVVAAGATLQVEFDVVNRGQVAATGQWFDNVYLSLDANLDAGDILIGSILNGSALDTDESYRSIVDAIQVPIRFRGDGFIIVRTDATNRVDEFPNDFNNTLAIPIFVEPFPPSDLVMSNVVAPSQAIYGSEIEVRYTVTNLGSNTTSTDRWTDTIWLARDPTRPTPGFKDPETGLGGNGGILIGTFQHEGSLAVGESYEMVVRVRIPSNIESGVYYITPWTDAFNVVLEDTFANNINPDDPNELDNNNYKGRRIDLIGPITLSPDLRVIDVQADATGSANAPFRVSWTVENSGEGGAGGDWFDEVYISDMPDMSASGAKVWLLGRFQRPQGLESMARYTMDQVFNLAPSVAGKYVIVVTDTRNQVSEAIEDNNSRITGTDVSTPAADLRVVEVVAPADNFSGEKAVISWTVVNEGAAVWSGTRLLYDAVWVSPYPTFNPSTSYFLGRFVQDISAGLATGGSYTNSGEVVLPAGVDGPFFVYVITDVGESGSVQLPEFDRGPNDFARLLYATQAWEPVGLFNNLGQGTTHITYREPDLVVSSLEVSPAPAQSGTPITVTYTVTNQGTRATRVDMWTDRIYLSIDPSLDSKDFILHEFVRRVGPLEAGDSYQRTVTLTLPEGLEGDYHILVYTDSDIIGPVVDGSVADLASLPPIGFSRYFPDLVKEYRDEGNNVTATPLTIELRPAPDLQVTEVRIPERVLAGQSLQFSYRVENRGDGDTPPLQNRWADHIYLSADEFLDPRSDIYLGQIERTGGLAVGEGYDQDVGPLRLPSGLVGSYYVFILTDAPDSFRPNGRVYEGAREGNNASPSAQPLLIELPPPADLVVDSITLPPRGTVNDSISISWTVTNQGENPAQGSWSDAVYLSLDGNWDITDRLLGRVSYSGGLDAGGSYTATISDLLIPPALEGQYRIIVRTDIFNEVYEAADEGNNARGSADPILIEVPSLTLGVAAETTLAAGQARLYKITVGAGETLRVSVKSDEDGASNEIFIRYNALPDAANFDAAFDQPLAANQQAIIPTTQAGTYYVLVRQFSGPAQSAVEIKAEAMPFQVTDIQVDQGGDSRWVTVTVTGARFHEEALLKLVRPGIEEIEPVRYQVVDATRIIATFDLRDRDLGLYDVSVINPGGARATLPYRFLIERALPIDVTIGLGGPRVIPAGQTGLYGVSLQSLTNVDTPYVYFAFGAPEIGENAEVYGLPFLSFSSNVGGAPDGVRTDVPWISLDSELNLGGLMLAPGYALDVTAGGYVGMSFNVTTYPGLQALLDRDLAAIRVALEEARWFWSPAQRETLIANLMALASTSSDEAALRAQLNLSIANLLEALTTATAEEAAGIVEVIEVLQRLTALDPEELPGRCVPLFAPFRFNVFAAATPMTRDEFVVRQTADVLAMRTAILADPTASVALINLAADEETWVQSYLAALEEAGLLRPEDEAPPIRTQPKVISTMAVLSTGVLVGPAGQEVQSPADLVAFFSQVRRWYGDTPGQLAPIAGYDVRESDLCGIYLIPIPALPQFEDFNLGLSQQTYFATFNVFTPWGSAPDSAYGSVANTDELTPLQLQELLALAAQADAGAAITGPQGFGPDQFVPGNQALPFTIRFENAEDSKSSPAEIRIVTQLDDALSPRSFRLGGIKLGDINVNIPAGRSNFQGDFDLTASRGFILRVSAGIDTTTNTATWLLQAIDPETGELLRNTTAGLLLPNNTQDRGVGTVSYSVTSAFGLETNEVITASARIIFNNAPPVDTPEITRTLDMQAPVTTVSVTRLANGVDYEVRWAAVEEPGGSGVRHTTIYVAEDGGAWQIWQRQSAESFAVFSGEAGKRYEFLAVSTDNAGNQERPVAQGLPDDGTQVNLGTLPDVGPTTRDPTRPPPASEAPSTNVLFLEARQGIPAGAVSRPSQFGQVLAPFKAEVFATGIGQSHADIGPVAILVRPDGSVIVSGGANRGQLYAFSEFGGRAVNPVASFTQPIYDLAYDLDGRLWATTGGGQLLHLDADNFSILGSYGESLTQALAVHPVTGELYVSSGNGIEIFDPVTLTFRAFSNYRVDDLAFSPDGRLWGTSWPDRGDVVTFDNRGRATVQLRFDDRIDSMAFGKSGTALSGLLFLSSHPPAGSTNGANLVMVDLATLQRVNVASQGPLAEGLAIAKDGSLLIGNSRQVDVLMPLTPPSVVRVTPADGVIAPLPVTSVTITFDQDMLANGQPGSVFNPANYRLTGQASGVVEITSIDWNTATRSVTLGFGTLMPDVFTLTLDPRLQSVDRLPLKAAYSSTFIGVQDFSALVSLEFVATRSDRSDGSLSFDVRVTNITDYNLQTPLVLLLDPGRYFQGSAVGASLSDQGLWMLDVGAGLANGILAPGQSTIVRTVTLTETGGQRVDLGYGLYAVPYANRVPEILSTPAIEAVVGEEYAYQLQARDPDGVVLNYALLQAPAGMTIDDTGMIRWMPTAESDAMSRVILRVYDSRGGFATQAFDIVVAGGNNRPVIADLPDGFELREGTLFRLGLDAFDPDGQMISLYVDNLPPGAVFDTQTRLLTWLPGFGQAGYYGDMRIIASDGLTNDGQVARPAGASRQRSARDLRRARPDCPRG
jgi:subtilase family serine protease